MKIDSSRAGTVITVAFLVAWEENSMVVKRHGSCKSRSDYRLVLSSGSGFPLRTRQDTPTILSFSSTARADNT